MDRASGRGVVWLFVGVLLCSCALAATTAAGVPAGPASSVERPAVEGSLGDLSTEAFEADRTRFLITVYENGSSEWVFRYEQRLEDSNATGAFETYAERFNGEETESYANFRARATALTGSGTSVTGREMAAEQFRRDARIEERPPSGDEFGVVEMSFVWTNFAESDGNRLVVGDVFVDGLYVGPEQQLRFDRGPDVRFESVAPDPDSVSAGTLEESASVTWLGEKQFTDRRPRIVYYLRDTGAGTGSGAAAGTEADTGSGAPPGFRSPVSLLAAFFVVLLGIGAALAYRSRDRRDSSDGLTDEPTHTETGAVEGTSPPTEQPQPASETTGSAAGTGSAAETGGAAAAEETDTNVPPAVSEAELRSDEELVVDLLEDHGGRMKQVDIVDGTEWSKSKVSMLLSEMEDDGVISKLRVGRENIVSLAGHEPDAAGSPFDDEG
ncbi:probable transmembrane glycoprotein / HTH domain protein [Natronomonas moolapensis 8.8.11]|uniref:Probable transmembrane glycoprotein / HTH domain protein n=1 Tax=Natronomonas moolapensis (strain DSM 18674 / CECT 7526 / JCM 14361 / 8.8.11) TaxID=268739 RepID=M1XR95_NATM8|nr:hypothetical protein [Natronomonas moolapensis]CCQ36751.1 probable transmembrane glycoprotein / HTH domain protein [Natronomonas moolapensis 8.8.11]